ncbi:hypothetical protein BG418_31060 [Streptomyces sp. CBMA152]|nr:hypothetical protein [Streptomyces sp. CBMA152]
MLSHVGSFATVPWEGFWSHVGSPLTARALKAAATTAIALSARTILLMADLHLFMIIPSPRA